MGRDGPSQLLFAPIELVANLAAIPPRPTINLMLSHGVLAPRARGRAHVVGDGRPAPALSAHEVDPAPPSAAGPSRAWTWAALVRRGFDLEVLACPRCGGRLRVVATVQDPAVVRTLLALLGRASAREPPGPAPPTPAAMG